MKSILIAVAAAVLSVAAGAGAQPLLLGVEAGATMSKLDGGESGASRYRRGCCAGAFLALPLVAGTYLQIEALYAQKGDRQSLTAGGQTYDRQTRFTYVEVPVLFKVMDGERTGVTIFAGPAVSFLTGSALEASSGGLSVTTDFVAGIREFDCGVTAGGGFRTASGVLVEGRYSRGLLKVSGDEQGPDLYNAAVSVMVGYAFRTGRARRPPPGPGPAGE
jgi:outer membrane immunogenic protein